MKKISYLELGATLFVPSTHKNLSIIVSGEKYPELKSVLIDTEDGIKRSDLSLGLNSLKELLKEYNQKELLVFIRPKNSEILKEILTFDGIDKVDGFVLPKFSLLNAQEYFAVLEPYDFALMPSVEGSELFNHSKLNELRDIILTNADKIVLVRYGLEDMLRVLSLRRECHESVFDFASTSAVLGNFIATFKSGGFAVSGGVYPCFKDREGFIKDVKRDLREGLFSKTIIHPNQIEIVNELYRVTQKEFDEAVSICKSDKSVFGVDGKMAEVATMTPHSLDILQRAKIYGVLPLPK
jgi:citrate lyase beta subunit